MERGNSVRSPEWGGQSMHSNTKFSKLFINLPALWTDALSCKKKISFQSFLAVFFFNASFDQRSNLAYYSALIIWPFKSHQNNFYHKAKKYDHDLSYWFWSPIYLTITTQMLLLHGLLFGLWIYWDKSFQKSITKFPQILQKQLNFEDSIINVAEN